MFDKKEYICVTESGSLYAIKKDGGHFLAQQLGSSNKKVVIVEYFGASMVASGVKDGKREVDFNQKRGDPKIGFSLVYKGGNTSSIRSLFQLKEGNSLF